jgi:hypothetical protein
MTKIKLLMLVTALMVFSGCAESSALIRASSTSLRTDVFEELKNGTPVPQGFTKMLFTATLKTHKPGIYSSKDIHGSPDYKLLLNVDGQAILLQGILHEESDGIRYMFSKDLLMRAGNHTVVVALPEDEVAVKRKITLVEGEVSSLVAEPVYGKVPGKRRPSSYSGTSFEEGIKGIRLKFQDRYN